MKTIEIIVRFNISVPDNTVVDLEKPYFDLDLSGNGKSGDIAIVGEDSAPLDYKINEYETLNVAQF